MPFMKKLFFVKVPILIAFLCSITFLFFQPVISFAQTDSTQDLSIDQDDFLEPNLAIESEDTISKESSSSTYPDLGDEQVFPFVAGLGKNSGKN
tara:strand:- start:2041 stop:2322 length:282 start_codon:yes stop_codon:yes gene_type:complete